ncbi:hypothetical protein [Micromonospora rubida]|uniref:hypothetical protein n=1 Tax=Micromonospora rubida TaxID=2697657 RepID=UPI001378891B|nr:hypothetical protein [Micromonospora rubida]NBE80110.1 hypothetical protein [Micromonospora rubida]
MPEFRRADYGPEFHRLLLRVAGHAPDDTIAEARHALAQGRVADVARAVGAIASAAGLALTGEEHALLAAAAPESVGELPGTQPGEWPPPSFSFTPALVDEAMFAPEAAPPLLDLTDSPTEFFDAVTDEIDHAAIGAMSRVPGATALWRAWRLGDPDGEAGPVAQVFVLATDVPTDDLPVVTALLQEELAQAGAAETLVEAYAPGDELPAYQAQARGAAALLWTAADAYPIAVARVFDGVDPATGPWFAPDHPRLDGADRERMVSFLESGRPVLTTTQRMGDIVEPERGAVVPLSYRTDGVWVWTDTVTYYLRAHGLAPDGDLLDHARGIDFRPALVDEVAEHRVLAALFRPAAAGSPTAARA